MIHQSPLGDDLRRVRLRMWVRRRSVPAARARGQHRAVRVGAGCVRRLLRREWV